MFSCAADEKNVVSVVPVAVPESHSLFSATDKEFLVVDTPVTIS